MTLPTDPVDRHLPKGPNFLAIVIGFAVVILIVCVAAWWFLAHHGQKTMPVDTHSTPSQTRLTLPPVPPAIFSAAGGARSLGLWHEQV